MNAKGIEGVGSLESSSTQYHLAEEVPGISGSEDMMEKIMDLNYQLKIQLRLLDAYKEHLANALEEVPEGSTTSEERILEYSTQVKRSFNYCRTYSIAVALFVL